MNIKPDILAAIGNTPLVKFRRASEMTGCTNLGKAEFLNPGQSVKDRAALFIVADAMRRAPLRPAGSSSRERQAIPELVSRSSRTCWATEP